MYCIGLLSSSLIVIYIISVLWTYTFAFAVPTSWALQYGELLSDTRCRCPHQLIFQRVKNTIFVISYRPKLCRMCVCVPKKASWPVHCYLVLVWWRKHRWPMTILRIEFATTSLSFKCIWQARLHINRSALPTRTHVLSEHEWSDAHTPNKIDHE